MRAHRNDAPSAAQLFQGTHAHLLEERHDVASMASSSSTAWRLQAMFQLTIVIMTSASAGPVAGFPCPSWS